MSPISGGLFLGNLSADQQSLLESLFPQRVSVHVPSLTDCTETGCGYEAFTDSALNPSCVVCHGTGQIITWHVGYVHCRVMWIDGAILGMWRGVPAGEIGEVLVQGKLQDQALFETLRDTQRAYILLDGRKIKPFSVTVNRVERRSTLDVRCHILSDAVE